MSDAASGLSSSAGVLVVDDEPGLRRFLQLLLSGEGWTVDVAESAEQALQVYDPARHDVVLQDMQMPGMDGIALIEALAKRDADATSVVMTAFSTWDSAVQAMRLGAYDYVKKPFDNDEIKRLVHRALERRRALRAGQRGVRPARPLIGNSAQLTAVLRLIERAATTDATVLVSGESGTGKELVARQLHHASLRRDRAFLSINCGALPGSLLESELFGHAKGAFTGAIADKPGLFALADGGTLFLDEVGEMEPDVQVKFLRALETREVMPVGGRAPVTFDVRFVAATNRDLAQEVSAGRFREDLFYRLNVIPVTLPPLRERVEDIPLLVGHFLNRYNAKMGRALEGVSEPALRALMAHDWPGNIRELENAVQRAVALAEGSRVTLADLPGLSEAAVPEPASRELQTIPPDGLDLEAHLAGIERTLIEAALERTDGHVTNAAKLLGMSFRQLRYRIKKLDIDR